MGSRYVHNPEYGGKVSLSGWREAKVGSEAGAPPAPPPSMSPDHPRVCKLNGAHAAAGCGHILPLGCLAHAKACLMKQLRCKRCPGCSFWPLHANLYNTIGSCTLGLQHTVSFCRRYPGVFERPHMPTRGSQVVQKWSLAGHCAAAACTPLLRCAFCSNYSLFY